MTVRAERVGTGRAARRLGLPLTRLAGGAAVLLFVGHEVGAGPFRDGLTAVTWPAVTAAFTLTAVTTVAAAWRWRVVAASLGVPLALPAAVGAYYRSQFLNSVVPGGVVGDAHRAVVHGRRAGDLGRGLRAVAWERLSGQVVQAAVAVVVLLALPSPVRPALPYLVGGVAAGAGCVAVAVGVAAARRGDARPARAARVVVEDLRRGLSSHRVWTQVALASLLVVAGHTITFVVAARLAGSTASLGELLALLMLVQVAMAIPLNVGGWGPREGVAGWAFAAAGLAAGSGVTVTTVYAVIALVALTPGAGLLLRDASRRAGQRREGSSGLSPRAGAGRAEREALDGLEAISG